MDLAEVMRTVSCGNFHRCQMVLRDVNNTMVILLIAWRWASGCHPRVLIRAETLEVRLYSPVTKRAARRWTISTAKMFLVVGGSHTQVAYWGSDKCLVAFFFDVIRMLRCRKTRVLLAFLVTLATCAFQVSLLSMVTPRYFALLTSLRTVPWMV